jgi:hypothetical protein
MRTGVLLLPGVVLVGGCFANVGDKIGECPGVMREAITDHVGTPTSFHATRTDETQVEGVAVVDGRRLSWACTPSTNQSTIDLDVRNAKSQKTVYADTVDG